MMRRYVLMISSFMIIVLSYGAAFAENSPPQLQTMSVAEILMTLLLCGLMGLVGQGCRVIVGMATLMTSNLNVAPTQQESFNLSRLVFSLIIGFLAGFVTALIQWKTSSSLSRINVSDFDGMFSFAVAGYIGTDIVEAFTVQFFKK